MNTLTDTLYNLLSFMTEDAIANKLWNPSQPLLQAMLRVMEVIEKDEQ